MEPAQQQPTFELPLPGGSESGQRPQEASLPVEQRQGMSTSQPVAPASLPAAPDPVMIPVAPLPPMPANGQSQSPAVADDSDLIEKEWVVKAKQIVAATREDPHTQARELSKFKADYLKKRYNKDIRVEG